MKKCPFHFARFSVTATLLTVSMLLVCHAALAKVRFNPPPMTAPGNRESGAVRSETCAATTDVNGLMALLPESNIGLTTKAYPTFAAYIPANNAERIEFRLYDEEAQAEVYVGQVEVPASHNSEDAYSHGSAVVSVSLPEDGSVAPLEAGKSYLWALMMVCNGENRAEDVVVTGVVQRVDEVYINGLDPAIQQELSSLDTASEQEKLSIYGEAGIWQDLVSELIPLTLANPTTYKLEWSNLLTDQGLGAVADASLVVIELSPLQSPSSR